MQFVTPTIAALKKRGEEIRQKEMQKAYNRLGNITEREKKIISSMTNSIVNQLLHDPVMELKKSALTKQGHLQNLFNLDVPKEKQFAAERPDECPVDAQGHPGAHPGGHPGEYPGGRPMHNHAVGSK